MTVRTLMFLSAVLTHQLHAKVARRTSNGFDVTNGNYQYVVALVKDYRRCTGTLMSPNWVLTAAHCLAATTHIQYGNLSIPFSESETLRKVISMERPPASKFLEPDLGLIYVNSVPMDEYGQLSAVDYKAMVGRVIEYGSFGFTRKNFTNENEGVLQQDHPQLREGVVSLCNEEGKSAFVPYLCVAPKCSDRNERTPPGEPGSPLFHAGKLAGVHVGTTFSSIRPYTPVSPYLSWVQRVMTKGAKTCSSNSISTEYEYRRFQDFTRYLQGLKARLASYKDAAMSQENYQKVDAKDPRRSETVNSPPASIGADRGQQSFEIIIDRF